MATDSRRGYDPVAAGAAQGAAQGATQGAAQGAAEGAARGAASGAEAGAALGARIGAQQEKRSGRTWKVSDDAVLSTPVYFKRQKAKGRGKRKKKKYTRGTKGLQRLFLGATRAAYRTTNSVTKGLNTFVRRSKRSARKRKDGLIRDSLRNASRGFNSGVKEAGRAPGEVTRKIGRKNVQRIAFAAFPN